MSRNERSADEGAETNFSFGVRELAQVAEVSFAETPLALVAENKGFDPYNSTGRFDRHDAWSRTRKR